MEAEYQEASRTRFVPFVRLGLICGLLMNIGEMGLNLLLIHSLPMLEWRALIMGFYLIILGLTYVPGMVRHIHAIGVVSMIGVMFYLSFLCMAMPLGFVHYMPALFIPLLMVPIMTSFAAAFATVWMAISIIYQFAVHSGVPPESMAMIKNVLCYFAITSLSISWLVTQFRRASFITEKNLDLARAAAETANAAKSMFLATMSHEVRTPLGGILGIVNLLKDTKLDTMQRDYMETIQYSGETLLTIVNNILDFSKAEAGKVELEKVHFSLDRLIHSVVTLMDSRAAEKGLAVEYRIQPDVPDILNSDPTRLRQILLNFIGNAIKFTESGGVIIRVFCLEKDGSHARLRFEVTDSGIGISPEAQAKLFQDYAQADSSTARKYGGTGLGLAICRRIVEAMEGRVGVTSENGDGSTFWFEIPVQATVNKRAKNRQEIDSTGPAQTTATLRILAAEDNPINRKVLEGLLTRIGHKVSFAENGELAVAMVKSAGDPFDLVLMDMQMPVMDGPTAAQSIRAHDGPRGQVPIIALSASNAKSDEQRCLAAGMDGYLSKPINPDELYKILQNHTPGEGAAHARMAQDIPALPHDYSLLMEMESMLGPEYVQKIAEEGLTEVRRLIRTMCDDTGERRRKTQAAHDLKNLSSLFGLPRVTNLAEGIENCFADDCDAEAAALCEQLDQNLLLEEKALRTNYLARIAQNTNSGKAQAH